MAPRSSGQALNARMLESVPTGFAFDERHTPHVTLLQRYVHTEQLSEVYAAVGATWPAIPHRRSISPPSGSHQEDPSMPGVGSAVVSLVGRAGGRRSADRADRGDEPWTAAGGDAAAFVTSDEEPEIDAGTLEYVERFVPDHSRANFAAHVTVGMATLDDLATLEAEPFESFTFHPSSFAVYRLGNHGTAQTGCTTGGPADPRPLDAGRVGPATGVAAVVRDRVRIAIAMTVGAGRGPTMRGAAVS